jgi:hypothetical protein
MDRIIAAALLALALPGSVRADQAETIDDEPPALALDAELVRSFVFVSTSRPERLAVDLDRAVTVVSTPVAVLDWVSPVFVWLEPGYAYAETSISFE